jgi:hypothetical protein
MEEEDRPSICISSILLHSKSAPFFSKRFDRHKIRYAVSSVLFLGTFFSHTIANSKSNPLSISFLHENQASSPGVFFVYNTSFYFELKTLCVICEYPEDCPDKVFVESNFISPNHLHVKNN